MSELKLTDQELKELSAFEQDITDYKIRFADIIIQISNLQKEKDLIEETLHNLHQTGEVIRSKLHFKYGEVEVDIATGKLLQK